MASKRKITAKTPMSGNNRSHSLKATKRQFKPNLQTASLYVPEVKKTVRVRVTAQELKTIDKIGVMAFLERQGISLKSLL